MEVLAHKQTCVLRTGVEDQMSYWWTFLRQVSFEAAEADAIIDLLQEMSSRLKIL